MPPPAKLRALRSVHHSRLRLIPVSPRAEHSFFNQSPSWRKTFIFTPRLAQKDARDFEATVCGASQTRERHCVCTSARVGLSEFQPLFDRLSVSRCVSRCGWIASTCRTAEFRLLLSTFRWPSLRRKYHVKGELNGSEPLALIDILPPFCSKFHSYFFFHLSREAQYQGET